MSISWNNQLNNTTQIEYWVKYSTWEVDQADKFYVGWWSEYNFFFIQTLNAKFANFGHKQQPRCNNSHVQKHIIQSTSSRTLHISKYSKYVLSNLIIKRIAHSLKCNYFWWSSWIPEIRVSILETRYFFIDVKFFGAYLRTFDNKWSCKMYFFRTRLHIYHFFYFTTRFSVQRRLII